MTNEKWSYCTSEVFKTDLSELCENCPLTYLINTKIKHETIFEAREHKSILSKKDFLKYLKKETKEALTEKKTAKNLGMKHEGKKDPLRPNRILVYIWNKERIKALKKFIEEVEEDKKPGAKSFTWTGSPAQLEALCKSLKDNGYIEQGTTKEAFTAIFSGCELNDNPSRVTWIKRSRNKQINKLALIDLLTLMKFSKSEIEDNDKIKACFSDSNGISIKFSQANLTGNKSSDHSEFYNDLVNIFKSL